MVSTDIEIEATKQIIRKKPQKKVWEKENYFYQKPSSQYGF